MLTTDRLRSRTVPILVELDPDPAARQTATRATAPNSAGRWRELNA